MTTQTTTNGSDAAFQPLMEFWNKYFEQSGKQMQALLSGVGCMADPAAFRRQWQEAVAKSLDEYMRTPAFLETMRRQFEMMTQFKSINENWARDFSRSTDIPLVSDISGLFERLQMGQEAILARLGAIESRLSVLETKRKRNDC